MGAGASSFNSVYNNNDNVSNLNSNKYVFNSEIDEFASNEFVNPYQLEVFKSFIELSEQEICSLKDPFIDDPMDTPRIEKMDEENVIKGEEHCDEEDIMGDDNDDLKDNNDDEDDKQLQKKKKNGTTSGEFLMNLMNHLHIAITASNLANKCQFVELVDVESALHSAYESGQTPLILDTSPDDRVGVFFSYQPDVVTFEAKAMVVNGSHGKALADNMDELRRHLVAAMKYGKTLHIKLQNCAADFQNIWNDSSASTRLIHTKYDCYKDINTSLKGSWKRSLEQDTACIITENGKTKVSEISTTELEKVHGIVNSQADQRSFFPITALLQAGQSLHEFQDYWVPRLYTEDEIKPHKNFAVCKPGFKVFLSCAMTLRQAAEELFGYTLESNNGDDDNDVSNNNQNRKDYTKPSLKKNRLPAIENFSLISVVELTNDDDADKIEKEEKEEDEHNNDCEEQKIESGEKG